jgi:hypothetical protein
MIVQRVEAAFGHLSQLELPLAKDHAVATIEVHRVVGASPPVRRALGDLKIGPAGPGAGESAFFRRRADQRFSFRRDLIEILADGGDFRQNTAVIKAEGRKLTALIDSIAINLATILKGAERNDLRVECKPTPLVGEQTNRERVWPGQVGVVAVKQRLLREVDPAYAAELLTGMLKTFLFWPRFLVGSPPTDESAAGRIIDDCVAMFLSHYAHP